MAPARASTRPSGGCPRLSNTGCASPIPSTRPSTAAARAARPDVGIVTAIGAVHLEGLGSLDGVREAKAELITHLNPSGTLLLNADDPPCASLADGFAGRVRTFGTSDGADVQARRIGPRGAGWRFEALGHTVWLPSGARHDVLNAAAVFAVAREMGLDRSTVRAALASFRGVGRRLQVVGQPRGVFLVDDYAHHPTEVLATLETVREMYPDSRICCVFQPHQVCRTERLLDELAASLHNADMVVVADIFRAREPGPRPGEVAAADLARLVRLGGSEVADVHDTRGIVQLLRTCLLPGDVLVTMGAGDIRKLYHGIDERI